MTTPTGGTPTGTDLVTLVLGADATQPALAAKVLDELGVSTITVVKNLDELIEKADQEAAALAKGTSATRLKIEALNAEFEAQQAVMAAEKEAIVVRQAATNAGMNLIAKLEELNTLYGLTREQIYRVRAAELDVSAAAEPLIASLEELIQKDREWAIEQSRDIELYKMRQAAFVEEAAAVQKQVTIQQARDVEMNALRQKEIVAYAAWWEEQITIQDAAIAKQEAAAISFQAFKTRTMMENRAEAMRILTQLEVDAAALAEKQAIEEIKWNELSVQTRIAQLERLKAYQANPAISAKTIESSFSSAAVADLPNLERLTAQYNETVRTTRTVQSEAAEATNVFSAALGNNRVRTEGLVIAHEALQGRFTRIPGSLMVLTEYLNSASVGMTGFNLTTLGVIAGLALLGYGVIRGIEQTKELNAALIRTNGISGETRDSLDALAHSAGEVSGNFSQAYEAVAKLASSGKFTGEQIKEVTGAVVDLYHAFGTPLQESIKEFESLTAKANESGKYTTLQMSKAIVALDEKYHFLNTSILEETIALEKEGKTREAQAILIKAYADESERAAKAAVEQAGYVEKGWNAVTKAIKSSIQAIADLGKDDLITRRDSLQHSLDILTTGADGKKVDPTSEAGQNIIGVTEKYKEILALNKQINQSTEETRRNTTTRSEANSATMELEIARLKQNKKGNDELTSALQERWEVYGKIAAQNPNSPLLDQKLVNEDYLNIVREHTRSVGRIRDDGRKQDLLAQLSNSDAEYNALKSAVSNNEKLLAESQKQGVVTDEQYYAQLRLDRQSLKDGLDREYEEKIGYLTKYQSKSAADAEENKKRIIEVTNAHLLAIQQVDEAQQLSDAQEITLRDQKYQQTILAIEKEANTTIKSLDSQIEKQKEYNAEIGKTKEGKELAKKLADQTLIKEKESDAAYLDNLLKTQQFDDKATAAFAIRLNDLNLEIERLKKLSGLRQTGADKAASSAIQAAASEAWKQTDKKIADDLTTAILDGGGTGLKKLIRDFEYSFARMILNPIIQPIAGTIASFLNPGAAQATGAGSDIVNGLSAANSAKSLYNGASFAGNALFGSGSGSVASWIAGSSTVAPTSVAAANIAGAAGGDAIGTLASFEGWTTAASSAGTAAGATAGAEAAAGVIAGSEAGAAAGGIAAGSEAGAGVAGLGATEAGAAGASAAGAGVAAETGGAAAAEGSLGAMGPYGWVALAVLAAWQMFGGNGKEQNTSMQFANNNPVGNINNNMRGESWNAPYIGNGSTSSLGTFGVRADFWMDPNQEIVQNFIKTVGQTDDALAAFMTTAEKASVSQYLTGKSYTAYTGAEGTNPNDKGQLDFIFGQRIGDILNGIEPGLASLEAGFKGTSAELAAEVEALLKYRSALKDSGEAVFGAKVTLQEIAALKQPTENTSVALIRIANEFGATNQVAEMLGKNATTAFGAVGLASEASRAQLILLSGGLSTFESQASTYAQNYLTDAQRMAPATKALNEALGNLNLVHIPQTRTEFANIVSGLDLSTESGQKTYAALMALQEAFAQVHPVIDSVAKSIADITSERKGIQDQIDQMVMTSTELLTKQRDALDISNQALFDRLQIETKYKKDQTDAIAAVQKAYDAQNTSLQNTISSLESFKNSLNTFSNSLSLGNLSPLTPEQQYNEARQQYATTLQAAQGGDATAQSNLTSVAQAFLNASRTVNASDQQYQQDFYGVQKSIKDTAAMAVTQEDTAKASLAALNIQVQGLVTLNESVLSVKDAILNLNKVNQTGQASEITSLYQSLLGRAPDQSGFDYWMNRIQTGSSITQIAQEFLSSPEYLSLHSHAGGLEYVPYNGYKTELHEGETVLNAPEAFNYRNSKSDMQPLLVVVQSLREEVSSLKQELRIQTGALVTAAYDSNNQAANKIVVGSKTAAKDMVWSNKVKDGATIK